MSRADRAFKTLSECYSYLRTEFPDPTTTRSRTVQQGGLVREFKDDEIKWLFRGESDFFAKTVAADNRLDTCDLVPHVVETIRRTRERVTEILLGRLDMLPEDERPDPDLMEPYLQHYGFPTSHVDFTSSLKVAVFFASQGRRGRIAVLPIKEPAGFDVRDIRGHPYALRPRAQRAYSIVSREIDDWKSLACRRATALRWFSFMTSSRERNHFGSMRYLLETHTDAVASLVTSAMHTTRLQDGPIDTEAATWIAARIPPLPLTLRPHPDHPDDPRFLQNVPPGMAGVVYIDAEMRRANARFWSQEVAPQLPFTLMD